MPINRFQQNLIFAIGHLYKYPLKLNKVPGMTIVSTQGDI